MPQGAHAATAMQPGAREAAGEPSRHFTAPAAVLSAPAAPAAARPGSVTAPATAAAASSLRTPPAPSPHVGQAPGVARPPVSVSADQLRSAPTSINASAWCPPPAKPSQPQPQPGPPPPPGGNGDPRTSPALPGASLQQKPTALNLNPAPYSTRDEASTGSGAAAVLNADPPRLGDGSFSAAAARSRSTAAAAAMAAACAAECQSAADKALNREDVGVPVPGKGANNGAPLGSPSSATFYGLRAFRSEP